MKKIFNAENVKECLDKACEELNIDISKIDYEVIEEKKGFFKSKASISVVIGERDKIDDGINGSARVENGKIIIKNPKTGGKACSVTTGKVKLLVDGSIKDGIVQLMEDNKIEIIYEENIPSRNINISISENKMEVYVSIEYVSEKIYSLRNKDEDNKINLDAFVKEEIFPPKYTSAQIETELKKNNIVFGIIKDAIMKLEKDGGKNILCARGESAVDGKDDILELKFGNSFDDKKYKEDDIGNIDYKSIGIVQSTDKDSILAVRIPGDCGKDGKDINGKIIRHKEGKKINLKVGVGCLLKDTNTVVATTKGKPCVKNNTFCVYEIYELQNDIDMSTGNIKFVGDIIIYGSVKEDMEVEAGNSVLIYKDVEHSKILSKGDTIIKGNIISSKIIGGGQDVIILSMLGELIALRDNLKMLIETIEEIKKYDLLGQDKTDGQIIKVLIETKFRKISTLSFGLITKLRINSEDYSKEKLIELIKGKLIGISPVNIKHYSELNELMDCIVEKIDIFKSRLSIPVSVNINYCQDSTIQSSGDIVLLGKGEYVSYITARKKIIFSKEKSVARGGILKADEEIRCRIVGSSSGSSAITKLIVNESGHIWIDIAYENTVVIIGTKEYTISEPSKNVHAYLDDAGDIVVDKILL